VNFSLFSPGSARPRKRWESLLLGLEGPISLITTLAPVPQCPTKNHADIENGANREIRGTRESRFLFVYFASFAVIKTYLGENLGLLFEFDAGMDYSYDL